jgi:hypothetical protein
MADSVWRVSGRGARGERLYHGEQRAEDRNQKSEGKRQKSDYSPLLSAPRPSPHTSILFKLLVEMNRGIFRWQ